MRSNSTHKKAALYATGIIFLSTALVSPSRAENLTFAVHPIFSPSETLRVYQPLADYLSKETGHQVQLTTTSNFLVHWQLSKRGIYHLILEGPHMVDYRIKKMGYEVLARMPDRISYTLVAHQDQMVLDPSELVAKTVATMPAPSLGAVRLNTFFPNPLRQPKLLEADNTDEVIARVLDKKAVAAIVPSGIVGRYPELTTIATTEQAPAPGIVAAPHLDGRIRESLRSALLKAQKTKEGQAALAALSIPAFETATASQFEGNIQVLEGMWGY